MGFLWFLLKSVKKWRKAPFSQGQFAGLLFSEYLCIVRRENEDFDERTRRRVFLTRERMDEFFDQDENNAAAAEACKTNV
jgi:hypothetical protein